MKKLLNVLSAIMFSIVLIGTIAVGVYIFFIRDVPQTNIVTQSDKSAQDETAPVVVVDDVLKEAQAIKDRRMEKYAYKKEKSEMSFLDILFYGMLALLGYFLFKKLKQWWAYIVKNSV